VKSIIDTLDVIRNVVTKFERETKSETLIALIGGYAVVFYGIERTTLDVDVCFYSETKGGVKTFYTFLNQYLPARFNCRFMEASKDPSDPLKHDLIITDDEKREYPRIDILIARYKWEVEGLKQAKTIGKLSIPIMPMPYLLAMKLKAGSRQDELDAIELLKGMSGKEIIKAKELAKKVGRDKKLKVLLRER